MSTTSTSKPLIRQAHGLTTEQLKDVQLQQQSGDTPDQVTGNGGQKHKIAAIEAHLVHAEISVPDFDPSTGEDRSQKIVQKFDAKDFERMKGEGAFTGKKVTILHDGGEPAAEDIAASEGLKAKVVSQPGAGTSLTEDVTKVSIGELKAKYKELFPDEQNPPTKRGELVEAITARFAFLNDEKYRQEVAAAEKNRVQQAEAAERQQAEAAAAAEEARRAATDPDTTVNSGEGVKPD